MKIHTKQSQPKEERLSHLHRDHRTDLLNSGLSADTIERLHISSVRPQDIPSLNGVKSAYRIPYFDLDGQTTAFERWKLFPPLTGQDGHTRKYHQAAGTDPQAYFPPLCDWRSIVADPTRTIVITEGEKKAAKACQEGIPAIGIGGVWNWRVRLDTGERITLPALDLIAWEGRLVEIVPDSDAWRPRRMIEVLGGFYALAMSLAQRGARATLVKLPETAGAKCGLDDWLVAEEGRFGREQWAQLERIPLDSPNLKQLAVWWQEWQRKQQRAESSAGTQLAGQINAIRLVKREAMAAFEKKREISRLVLEDLQKRGDLIRTDANELFFFDRATKSLDPIDSLDFKAALYERSGLNSTEEETRFVEAELQSIARRQGMRVNAHSFSYWDPKKRRLYISAQDGTMYVLDGEKIARFDNGTDRVLFRSDSQADPIQIDEDGEPGALGKIFEGASFAGDAIAQVSSRTLLMVWVLGMFFREALPGRPIPLLVGEQGSGKTSLARRIGLALYGTEFQVAQFRNDSSGEADFIAAATARDLVVFDNADERIRWLPNVLCTLATGVKIERRELYTTNSIRSFRPRAFIMLTSRDPNWKRDDVASRLLPISMQSRETGRPEWQLQQEIIENRPRLWGAILTALNKAITELPASPSEFQAPHRLVDFWHVGQPIARALGIEENFNHAMETLGSTQLNLLGEGDEKLDLLDQWLTSQLAYQAQVEVQISALYEDLKGSWPGPDRTFPFRSTVSLGTWLAKSKALISTQCGVVAERNRRAGGTRIWIFTKNF